MCGIVGGASSAAPLRGERFAPMVDSLSHRGPDGRGLWLARDCSSVLGHRRLSIIDLTESGAQPMHDPTGELSLILNGEIYNYQDLRKDLESRGHRFRGQSDTEVLLAAYREWGTDCLSRLNGMFAFAIYDGPRRSLFLARDRAGEKPLYYRHANGALLFASELKALMRDPDLPRELDLEALDAYLAFGYVASERSLLRGVQKLLPAHAMLYDLRTDTAKVWRYWQLPEPCMDDMLDAEQLTDELEQLLRDAVRRQLVADVPVGILLSGGVDSSLVTAMAAQVSSVPVRTFNIAFPGHGSYDEAPYARLVASHFGTQHTELAAQPATVELLPELARQYDEPIADSSMVPTFLVSRLIREHATVALGGDGGDELFGGYGLYSVMLRQQQIRSRLPAPMRSVIAATAQRLPNGFRGRTYAISLSDSPIDAVAKTGIYFDDASRRRLSPALATVPHGTPEALRASWARHGRTLIQQLTAADFGTYLPGDILVKVDRAAMLASLEVRAPFLDHRVISFAFGRVPDPLRATIGERKILLKRLARRHLPGALDLNRKQGFSLPLATWLRGSWGEYVEDVLRGADRTLFAPREVERLLAGQRRGLRNAHRIFQLAIFELWRRAYDIRVS